MSETNGAAEKTTDELRGEYRRLRLKSKVAQAKAESRLLESWYYPFPSVTGGFGELVDPMDRYRDGDRLVVPMGLQSNQDGRNWPFVRSEQDLVDIRGISRLVCELNPFAIGALEGLTSFVVGDGMTARATSKEAAPQKELLALVQDEIDEFYEVNEFDEFQAELLRRDRRDGEHFLRKFVIDKRPVLRTVEPEQCTENGMPGTKGWSMGIRHKVWLDPETGEPHEDVQSEEEYWLKYDAQDKGERVGKAEVEHVKVNVDRSVKRGMPDFYPTAEAFEGVRKLLRNMREGAAIQAAIAGVREHAATQDKASTFQDNIKTRFQWQNPVTSRTVKTQKYDPGTIIDTGKGITYKPPPWVHGDAAKGFIEVAQAVLRLIGTRWNFPEYMISGDSSNANFASTLVSGAPFIRFVRRLQRFYKRRFLRLVRWALTVAIKEGRLPPETFRLIALQIEAPVPEIANELDMAKVDEIDIKNRVLSLQTRRQRRGLDNEQECANLKAEPPIPAPAPERTTERIEDPGAVPGKAPAADATAVAAPAPAPAVPSPTDTANTLRATVGGSQQIQALQTAFYAGSIPRDAAVANATIVFGFSPEEADKLFPEKKPQKLTPTPAAPEGRPGFFPRPTSP